jgi:hypothetical protein
MKRAFITLVALISSAFIVAAPPANAVDCKYVYKLYGQTYFSLQVIHYNEAERVAAQLLVQTRKSSVCADQIRAAVNIYGWVTPNGPNGTWYPTNTGFTGLVALALENQDGEYINRVATYRNLGSTGTDGVGTIYSGWTTYSYDRWLPSLHRETVTIRGLTHYRGSPIRYFADPPGIVV